MSTKELPPSLLRLHSSVQQSTSSGAKSIKTELELMGKLIVATRASDPGAMPLRDLEILKKGGFTGGAQNACQCCGRPF